LKIIAGTSFISEQFVTETKLFKGGSGTGTNFSKIRARGDSFPEEEYLQDS
jgi:ribonucleoside-diphosphate reductase alpha chain